MAYIFILLTNAVAACMQSQSYGREILNKCMFPRELRDQT